MARHALLFLACVVALLLVSSTTTTTRVAAYIKEDDDHNYHVGMDIEKERELKQKDVLNVGKKKIAKCAERFGVELGRAHGVPAYSNCNDTFTAEINNYYVDDEMRSHEEALQAVNTGMKWQCVEFARRYWVQMFGFYFLQVDSAHQIMGQEFARHKGTQRDTFMTHHVNGRAHETPKIHDLIIWDQHDPDMPHGHVAVVVNIVGNKVYIAEQNYDNVKWKYDGYSRVLTMEHRKEAKKLGFRKQHLPKKPEDDQDDGPEVVGGVEVMSAEEKRAARDEIVHERFLREGAGPTREWLHDPAGHHISGWVRLHLEEPHDQISHHDIHDGEL